VTLERDEGYYFVKLDGSWLIAHWHHDSFRPAFGWMLCGDEVEACDSFFEEIGTRIMHPEGFALK
jgi:hypothetical protein